MSFEEQVTTEYSSFDQMDNNAETLLDCPRSIIILLRNEKSVLRFFPTFNFIT